MSNLDHALRYLAMGLSVLPLVPRPEPDPKEVSKRPALKAWKHLQTTPASRDDVEGWWRQWPHAGVGIVTGAVSGVVVVDLDNADAVAWARVNLPTTSMIAMTGKGEHWYYKHPGSPVKNGVHVIPGLKVDIRADGGYVVAPPSIHPNGTAYTQAGDWPVSVGAITMFPSELFAAKSHVNTGSNLIGIIEQPSAVLPQGQADISDPPITPGATLIGRFFQPSPTATKIHLGQGPVRDNLARVPEATTRPAPVERARKWLDAKPATAAVGQRNEAFFPVAACVVNDFDLSLEEALPLLLDWNQRLAVPLEIDEVTKIARSAAQRARGPKGGKLNVAPGQRTTSTGRTLSSVDGENKAPPVIRVAMAELPRMVDEGAEALMAEPDLYQRGNSLVQVRQDGGKKVRHLLRPPAEPAIVGMMIPRLRELLSRSARWVKVVKDGEGGFIDVPAPVPEIVAQALAARPSWPFRPLEGIVECPTIRLDGSVLSEPGYDDLTGLLYLADGTEYCIPEHASREDALVALEFIEREIFSDFPFPAEHHRSAAVAALLTVVLRPAIAGPVPMFLLSASTPGSGKGLIAHVCATIATGRPSTLVTPCEREDSFKNAITSVALSGSRVILYDEVHTVGGPTLQSALTQWTWSDRAYHTQSIVTVPVRWVWFAAGQNVTIGGDMHRRVLQIRLEPPTENPEDRTDFRNPELEQWAKDHRSEIVTAVLTVAKAFYAAGRPQSPITPYGSYYAWSNLIRQVLVWLDRPDPNLTRGEVREAAAEARGPVEAMLEGWRLVFGDRALRLADAVADIRTVRNQGHGHDLWSALLEMSGTRTKEDVDTDRLGKLFRRMKGRIFNGMQLRGVPRSRDRVMLWSVGLAGDAGDGRGSQQSFGDDFSLEKSKGIVTAKNPCEPLPSPAAVVAQPELPLTAGPAIEAWPQLEVVDAAAMWLQHVGPASADMWRLLARHWPDAVAWTTAPADGSSYHSVAQQMALLPASEAERLMALAGRASGAGSEEITGNVDGNWRTWQWWATTPDTIAPWQAWLRLTANRSQP